MVAKGRGLVSRQNKGKTRRIVPGMKKMDKNGILQQLSPIQCSSWSKNSTTFREQNFDKKLQVNAVSESDVDTVNSELVVCER